MALQHQECLRERGLPEVGLGLSSHDVKVGKFKREAEVNLLKITMMNLWKASMHFIICLLPFMLFMCFCFSSILIVFVH